MLRAAKAGRIILVASIVALKRQTRLRRIRRLQGGLLGHVQVAGRRAGARTRVTVNCVSPGLVQRDDKDVSHTNYIGRNGNAAEVADLIAYLAAPEASFITGQNFVIDGGRSLGLKGSY